MGKESKNPEKKDEKGIVVSQKRSKKSRKNPFRAQVLKSVLAVIGTTLALGLINRFLGPEASPALKTLTFTVGGCVAMAAAGNILQYHAYNRYRRITKKEPSKEAFIRLQNEVWEIAQNQGKEKRKKS